MIRAIRKLEVPAEFNERNFALVDRQPLAVLLMNRWPVLTMRAKKKQPVAAFCVLDGDSYAITLAVLCECAALVAYAPAHAEGRGQSCQQA